MEFRIISLPKFRAVSSGVDKNFDFSPEGVLGKFDTYFSKIIPSPRDSFMPRDFLFYDPEQNGLVWWWALADGMEEEGHEIVDFEGGLYLAYVYKDGDDKENNRLYQEALEFIKESPIYGLDEYPNHYAMGHIITPQEIIDRQGWAQMETFIPIKLI